MAEEIKNVNAVIDKAEDAVKKYASKDTVISIGGYEFTPAKLMVAFTLVSSILGGLYGAFEVYKSYQDMQKKIANYVTPDLSEFDKRLAVMEQNSQKELDYVNNIKNDLKADIRRQGDQVDQVERSAKQSQRETDQSIRDLRNESRATQKEVESKIATVQKEIDNKIQKAMDNPLSGR
jgi:hypothetical protein